MTPHEPNADLIAEITALRERVASLTRENTKLQGALAEASEQQTATSEILRVISSSPTIVQPVLDAVVESAVRLCDAYDARIWRLEGDRMVRAAGSGPLMREDGRTWLPLDAGLPSTQAFLEQRTVQMDDVTASGIASVVDVARRLGIRAVLATPLMREGQPIGVLTVRRREGGPFSNKHVDLLRTFADQAVIAIENVRLFTETKQALEQQTGTSEILRVISTSPTQVQPVFDAIVCSAVRLCDGHHCSLFRFDGERQHFVAHYGVEAATVAQLEKRYPRPPHPATVTGAAILEAAVIHVTDVATEPRFAESREITAAAGYRAAVAVPMFREQRAIGVIFVVRSEARKFTDKQIALLKTFADQAVIAIENVRLFNELQEKNRALTQAHAQVTEALEQKTATSEILRVISQSPTDVQPVFDAIAESAARLCSANDAQVLRVEGNVLRLIAAFGAPSMPSVRQLTRGHLVGRAVIDRKTIHVRDLAQALAEYPETTAARFGVQSALAVPLLREGVALGVIRISRTEILPFAETQIALVQTFADQAVIAIENVRLFNELQEKNRALTAALEQQTATSEILKVISSSPTDVQPVFDTIVENAARLCDTVNIALFRREGDSLRLVAHHGLIPPDRPMGATRPIERGLVNGRAVLERRVIHLADLQAETHEFPEGSAHAQRVGWRTTLVVPLVRENTVVGTLAARRADVQPFSDKQIELLRTFADQAVIAIENVRLFHELEAANRELAAASQHKSEFLANMSHELRTPLNAIIGFSEVLSERMFGELNEKQDEYLKDINASGTHLLSLINDILDLSKIEAGRMELDLTEFDLLTALDSALTLVRERAGRRSIALHMTLDHRLGQIQADERKVRQVVLNLLSNAIKFTPQGGRIEVRALPIDSAVEVSVSDTGVGIASEDQEAIFEEFRQVGTADRRVEGTGLGLALSRRFVELHGGRIWVTSQVGVGSTFTFTIPTRH
jgi:two-component system, NtrC family, sensor kinase